MRRLLLGVLFGVVTSAPLYGQTSIQARDPVTGLTAVPGNSARQALNVANAVQEAIDTNVQNFLSSINNTVFTAGTVTTVTASKGIQILFPRRDANTTLCATDGAYCPPQLSTLGAMKVAVTEGANTDVAQDAVPPGTPTGPLQFTIRKNSLSSGTSTNGRYSPMYSNIAGAHYVTQVTDNPAGTYIPASVISAASTNATNFKNAPGNLYGGLLVNNTATRYFIKFYNTASTPTCSNAAVFLLEVPPSDSGFSFSWPGGVGFTTGLSYCIVADGTALTGVGNAAVGITGVLLYF